MGSKFEIESLEDYKQVEKFFELKGEKTSKHSALQFTVRDPLIEKYDFDGERGRKNRELFKNNKKMGKGSCFGRRSRLHSGRFAFFRSRLFLR